ncbi:MAG TPA: protein-glutamate O-methyltransferase CheR [Bryobacteraceae bacterium]|nr:protein-glutamate O-methyltransferase CheR [Bryobacteraceae bacterium]
MTSVVHADADIRPLSAREFEQIRRLAHEKVGLDLRDGKETLVSARLGKKMRELHFRTFQEYYRYVVEDKTGEALTGLIDALTTNHTSFFREPAHFEFLRRTILPDLRRRERIAMWSAACSTGEEPYSLAFCLLEELGEAALRRIRILATDISTRVLATAQRGAYPADRFEGIAAQQLRQHLLRGEQRCQGWYRVKPEVRAMVEFRRLNLMEGFAHLGHFSVIFCRNVMIYFDRPTQQNLVNRLAGSLEPGGYLLIGHAESLNGVDHPLQYMQPAVYRKAEANGANTKRGWSKG